jgi:3-methylcrotonyl-CoA carboxylase alpha subunit
MGSVKGTKIKGITRVLVANRGEISCRIQNTCHRLGIETIAIGSSVDQESLPMQMAHKAVVIGSADAKDNYLNGAVIIQTALQQGADAIHPGYGFLSENPDFAESVHEAGLIFIGPSPDAIRAMGSKVQAKAIAQSVKVPVIYGHQGGENLLEASENIGFPLLIKAIYGGGGKGMRLVNEVSEFVEALAACRREAMASFGNDEVMLERYIYRPRHVEVQVLGDSYGRLNCESNFMKRPYL